VKSWNSSFNHSTAKLPKYDQDEAKYKSAHRKSMAKILYRLSGKSSHTDGRCFPSQEKSQAIYMPFF